MAHAPVITFPIPRSGTHHTASTGGQDGRQADRLQTPGNRQHISTDCKETVQGYSNGAHVTHSRTHTHTHAHALTCTHTGRLLAQWQTQV